MRKIAVTEAVGMTLCHDITRIIPGREKGRAFRKGHVITRTDIPLLQDLGKEHVFVWDPTPDMVHEDEAAIRLARHSAGSGIGWDEPNQGRVNLRATYDGILKVQVDQLNKINGLDNVIMSTLHNNRPVQKDQNIAGTRVIPLAVNARTLQEAEKNCSEPAPLLSVKPFHPLWVGIVATGSEIYSGHIKDCFFSLVRQKTSPFGGRPLGQVIVPDNPDVIATEIRSLVNEGADLVMVTGGMSVDPNDVTPAGIRAAGADVMFYGSPVLPGAMFMLAYLGHVAVCGLPGCVMFNRTTVFDLVLPRLFAGEHVTKQDIVSLGHGGLCQECDICRYPACPFGKA